MLFIIILQHYIMNTTRLLKLMNSIFTSQKQITQLGRWNSVINKVTVEENKYIDWGNSDHCYCGTKCNEKTKKN